MAQIEIKNLSYRYPDSRKPALSGLNLKVKEGDFVVVQGPSGSGKTTLLKCINGLIPHYSGGFFQGKVVVNGLDSLKNTVERISLDVGSVLQDPENQIICTTVESEIVFGLENLRKARSEIQSLLTEITNVLEIKHLLKRKISELSSGEKQKVILASVLAMNPKILILDEPSSQLDPENSSNFQRILFKLNKEKKTTIILVDHNFTQFDKVDKIVKLNASPGKILEKKFNSRRFGKVVVKISNLHYKYPGKKALDHISLNIHESEFLSIVGPNGCGKTTLLKHINGLLKPYSGSVFVNGLNTKKTPVEEFAKTVGFLSQNPNDYLFCDTVAEELEFTLKNLKIKGDIDALLEDLHLMEYKKHYPRDLSGGERQRVALASVLIANPKIVVLDEPTRGIDFNSKIKLLEILREMQSKGKTIIIATHDLELASNSDRVIQMKNGRIVKND